MKKAAFVVILAIIAVTGGYLALNRSISREMPPLPTGESRGTVAAADHPSFLYGRITTIDGAAYEGRLRWGGSQEAFWGDYFNGAKTSNPWVAHVPPERLPKENRPVEIFGIEVARRDQPIELGRLLMARFGDIGRIEAEGREVKVTLKSGTVVSLGRFSASDFDDGVRVWDATRGVVDLDSLRIRTIELLPTPRAGTVPDRLYGTVRTKQGEFTGFVQWDREQCLGSDELKGRAGGNEVSVPFNTIRSIERRSPESALVTLTDGRELTLSGSREVGEGHLGVYVDEQRYGRVLVSWNAFERIDFKPSGSGPSYGDFPRGGPLTGSVTTRTGRLLTGRLVYDLDESEITETLDAPSQGVDYTIPFGLIESIVLPSQDVPDGILVTLHGSAQLRLQRSGDLGKGNAGMLIFTNGGQTAEYVTWNEIEKIVFDRPPAMYPKLG